MLSAATAQQRVRALAADTANLVWTNHIQQRMAERGIEAIEVLRILRTGDVDADPVEAEAEGDWKIKLTRRMTGGRTAGVVTVLVASVRLVLLTVEWEDLR